MSTKILYTTTSYLPAIGGAQLHTHQIIRHLSLGWSAQVITQWDTHRTDWLLGTTLNAPPKPYAYLYEDIPVQLITLTRAERYRLFPFIMGYYAFKPVAITQIASILAQKIEPMAREAALIHNVRIGREPLSFASYQVACKLGLPFVFAPYHHPRWVGWNYREYLKLYRQADAVIALTQTEKQTLVELGVPQDRVFVTGMGPIVAAQANPGHCRQTLGLSPDTPLILFLGQKYRYKGFETLVAAAKLIWREWPQAHFLFIGPPTPFSKKFFARQNDARLIEWATVNLQQKTDALAACTIFCLPSTQESFGGVFTEAWSFGKPVIGADIPAVREVIDDGVNGCLVTPTAAAIAAQIDYLLQNPTMGQQMGQAGREKTQQQYSWPKLAQKTEEIYTTVLKRHLN